MTKNMKTMIIVGLIVAVAALSVGYAALSQTLNISANATLQKGTWNVVFGSGSCVATGSATAGTVSGSGTNSATVSGVVLALPGDTVTCTVPITNAAGNIDAKLSSFTTSGPTISGTSDTDIKGWITTSVTYDGSTDPVTAGKTAMAAGTTKNVVITYTYSSAATKVPDANVSINGLTVTANYVQA